MARECAAAGCKALFLPEVFAFLGKSQQESLSAAQPLNGPVMERYRTLARSTGLWMSLGGFQEASPFPDRMHNTHVIICPEGKTRAAYRKVHLFDVDVPSGPLLMESRCSSRWLKQSLCCRMRSLSSPMWHQYRGSELVLPAELLHQVTSSSRAQARPWAHWVCRSAMICASLRCTRPSRTTWGLTCCWCLPPSPFRQGERTGRCF